MSISRSSSWCASSKSSSIRGSRRHPRWDIGLRGHAFHLAPVLRDPDLDLILFLVYTFITELNELFGDGELYRILFTWRSTDLKLTRRQRIRILTKLSRLTAAHTPDELRDPATRAHAEMLRLLRELAMRKAPASVAPSTLARSPS